MIPAGDLVVAGLQVCPTPVPQGIPPKSPEELLGPAEDVTDLRVRLAAAEARGDALEQALRIVATRGPDALSPTIPPPLSH